MLFQHSMRIVQQLILIYNTTFALWISVWIPVGGMTRQQHTTRVEGGLSFSFNLTQTKITNNNYKNIKFILSV